MVELNRKKNEPLLLAVDELESHAEWGTEGSGFAQREESQAIGDSLDQRNWREIAYNRHRDVFGDEHYDPQRNHDCQTRRVKFT